MKLISSSKTDTCLSLKFKYSSEHERALSCIVNSILSTKCFVVSLSAQEVSFNLEGDYFVLPLEVVKDYKDVYATVDCAQLDDGELHEEETVVLSVSETPMNTDALHILTKDKGVWSIPENSTIKIRTPKEYVLDEGNLK